jgi:hypothetical protein
MSDIKSNKKSEMRQRLPADGAADQSGLRWVLEETHPVTDVLGSATTRLPRPWHPLFQSFTSKDKKAPKPQKQSQNFVVSRDCPLTRRIRQPLDPRLSNNCRLRRGPRSSRLASTAHRLETPSPKGQNPFASSFPNRDFKSFPIGSGKGEAAACSRIWSGFNHLPNLAAGAATTVRSLLWFLISRVSSPIPCD